MKKLSVAGRLVCALILHGGVCAQDRVQADLADQAVSPEPLQAGTAQAELGVSYTRFLDDESTALNSLFFMRYGVNDRLELGITGSEGRNRDKYVDLTVQGLYPLALSGRYALAQKENSHTLSLVGFLQLPVTAHSEEQSIYWSPTILLAAEKTMGNFGVVLNAGVRQQPFDKDWTYSLNAGLDYEAGERVSLFLNYYAQLENSGVPQHNAGGGMQFLTGKSMVWFLTGGRSLNPRDPNWFAALGAAVHLAR